MSLIIFSHANSFPASTYGLLFKSLRARGHTVRAIEKFGHEPGFPVTDNWPKLCGQLHGFAAAQCEQAGQGACLVGHSLGGILSAMVAARHPVLGGHPVLGVLLLDSPMLGGWKARALKLAKAAGVTNRLSPGKISSKRRWHWNSRAEALAFFQGKRAFAHWHPQVLQDFIAHGLQDYQGKGATQPGAVQLAFRREVETDIYNMLPDNLEALLRRHPLRCPVAYLAGTRSHEGRQVGLDLTRKLAGDKITWIEGSHLYPMERPLETAAAIEQALNAMAASATSA
jgi:pimeloyl-ACP methyl ester carboxylesterase